MTDVIFGYIGSACIGFMIGVFFVTWYASKHRTKLERKSMT